MGNILYHGPAFVHWILFCGLIFCGYLSYGFGQTGNSLDIRRNDNLIGLSVGGCLERLQALKLKDCIVSPCLFDEADTVCRSLLYGTDGLCLSLGLLNLLFLLSLRL